MFRYIFFFFLLKITRKKHTIRIGVTRARTGRPGDGVTLAYAYTTAADMSFTPYPRRTEDGGLGLPGPFAFFASIRVVPGPFSLRQSSFVVDVVTGCSCYYCCCHCMSPVDIVESVRPRIRWKALKSGRWAISTKKIKFIDFYWGIGIILTYSDEQ